MARDINIGIFADDSGARKAFDGIKNSMNNLGRQTKSTTGEFSKFYNETRKLNNRFSNITKDANRSANSINRLGGSVRGLSMAIKGISFFALGQALGQMVQSSLDMVETTHLFNVALGDMAIQTNELLENLSQLYGLDITNLRNFAGTYASLGRSMGMVTHQSAQLSTNMVQLGIDLSSLYNIPINQVMQDLRSGLVGQSETVYKYGMDVTEASLKQEALNLGIEKSVRNMTQGEKMYLRQSVMMRQAGLSMEDFAETINQPANQLKILGERFVTLGRSIGSVFQPVLQRVLPYLQAIVIVLTDIINALALLLGYEPPDIENTYTNMNGALNDTADSLDGVSGSAKDATDAIKKFKKVTLGFDELNIIKEPEATKPSNDSGSGGFGGSGIFDGMKIPDYGANISLVNKATEMADNLKQKLSELKEIAQPTTDALSRLWNDGLKPIGEFVWDSLVGFYDNFLVPVGEWTLSEGLPRLLDVITGLLSSIDWDRLLSALNRFWEALAPFSISIGRGLLNFLEDLSEVLTPALNKLVEYIADRLEVFADVLDDMSAKEIENLGYAIGVLGASFLTFKGLETVVALIGTFAKYVDKISTFVSEILGTSASGDGMLLVALLNPLVDEFDRWVENEAPNWVKKLVDEFSYALAGFSFGGVIGTIIGALGGPIGMLGGAISGSFIGILISKLKDVDWKNLANTYIIQPFLTIFNFDLSLSLFDNMIEYFKEALDGDNFLEIGKNILLGILSGIAGAFEFITAPIKNLFTAIWDGLKAVFGIQSPATEMEPIGMNILLGIVEGFVKKFSDMWKAIKDFGKDVGKKLSDAWDDAKKGINDITVNFRAKVATKVDDIKTKWKQVSDEWKDKTTTFRNKTGTTVANIKTWWEERANQWKDKTTTFKNSVGTTVSTIKTWFSDRSSEWKNKTAYFYNSVSTSVSSVKSWWKSRADEWKNKTATLSLALTTTAGNIKNFVNEVIKQINNKVIAKLDFSIKVPNWLGGGSWGWKAPRIKYLAKGGIVNSPTLSMVGEAGREAVIPLENNTGWIDTLAGDIISRGGLGGSSLDKNMIKTAFKEALKESDFGDTVLYVGNEELARATNKGNKMLDRRYKLVLE